MLGREWKNKMESEILTKLAEQLTIRVATLKASSTFDHTKIGMGEYMSSEALASRLGDIGLNPILKFSIF